MCAPARARKDAEIVFKHRKIRRTLPIQKYGFSLTYLALPSDIVGNNNPGDYEWYSLLFSDPRSQSPGLTMFI